MFSLGSLGAEEEAFRREVSDFLEEWRDEIEPFQFFHGRGGTTRRLYRALGERGWLSLSWPRTFGGKDLPVSFEFVLWDELAYARAARPDLGPGVIAHSIIAYGTTHQQHRYLPGIASGKRAFALGYSEPEAGSDLAALRTRAVRDGDSYIVSGEKCWTSDAHHADHLWLLCRTGTSESRGRGLTLLVVDLASPGVTITPIETIDGHQLNNVFLEDVVVPADQRVGEENEAWGIIREALAVERHVQLLPGRVRRDFDDLVAAVVAAGRNDDPVVEHRISDLAAQVAMVVASSYATLAELLDGGDGVVAAARTKLLGTSLTQEIAAAGLELSDTSQLIAGAPFALYWPQTVMETIGGGTSEVMRGIIAREALGLGASR